MHKCYFYSFQIIPMTVLVFFAHSRHPTLIATLYQFLTTATCSVSQQAKVSVNNLVISGFFRFRLCQIWTCTQNVCMVTCIVSEKNTSIQSMCCLKLVVQHLRQAPCKHSFLVLIMCGFD